MYLHIILKKILIISTYSRIIKERKVTENYRVFSCSKDIKKVIQRTIRQIYKQLYILYIRRINKRTKNSSDRQFVSMLTLNQAGRPLKPNVRIFQATFLDYCQRHEARIIHQLDYTPRIPFEELVGHDRNAYKSTKCVSASTIVRTGCLLQASFALRRDTKRTRTKESFLCPL